MLTHLVMPDVDGLSLTDHATKKYPNMPVLVATAVPNGVHVSMQHGAYDCLRKPIERAQLLTTVSRALEYRRAKLENRYEPERILIQDDEEAIREVVSSMLSSAHYECCAVESPKEVLEVLSSDKKFDLVFCGLVESLDEKLLDKLFVDYPSIPVLVATACHDMSLFLTALRKGAYDYLMKPFEREQLLVVVRRALEYRRLKLENQALLASKAGITR